MEIAVDQFAKYEKIFVPARPKTIPNKDPARLSRTASKRN